MMLGAMVAIRKYKVVSPLKSGGYALVSLITYYVLMGIYKIDPFFCKFQLISLIPLLSSIYWIYRFCDTPQIYKNIGIQIRRKVYLFYLNFNFGNIYGSICHLYR